LHNKASRFWFTCYIAKLNKFDIGKINPINSYQLRTRYQMDTKQRQSRNKWEVVSRTLQPLIQSWDSLWLIPQQIKLSLVGNLLRKSRHANTNTFKGTLYGKNIGILWSCIGNIASKELIHTTNCIPNSWIQLPTTLILVISLHRHGLK